MLIASIAQLVERTSYFWQRRNLYAKCAHSSVGRAVVLYTTGPWFESRWAHFEYKT